MTADDGGRVILCGPAGSGKTEAVLAEYVEGVRAHGEDAVALLLPTRLACERVRRRLVREGRLPGLLDPRILTFPDLAHLLLEANHEQVAGISALQQRLLLRSVIDELRAAGELPELAPMCVFPGFRDSLGEFIEELKRIAIDPLQFRERLARSGAEDARGRELGRVYERYQKRLRALELYDDAGLFWWARDVLAQGKRRPFEALRLILVDGFDDFTTTQLQVLRLLAEPVERLVVTLALEPDATRRPEVFRRLGRTLEKLRAHLGELPQRWLEPGESVGVPARMGERLFAEEIADPLPDPGAHVAFIEASGQRAEVREVAGRVKRLLLSGVDPERIALIARDLGSYATVLGEVFGELGVPLRLRGGRPVGSRPPVQTVLDVLRVPAEGYRASHVLRVVKAVGAMGSVLGDHPPDPDEIERVVSEANIIGGSGPEEWRERLQVRTNRLRDEARRAARNIRDEEDEWYRGGEERLQADLALIERVEVALSALFAACAQLPERATPAGHVEALAGLLERLGLHEAVGDARDEHSAANLAAWSALLEGLRTLWTAGAQLGVDAEIDLPGFYAEVLALSKREGFDPPASAAGVPALDAGAARQLDFDHVFLLGMTEHHFPRAPREDPIYADEQRELLGAAGIPLESRRDGAWEDALLFYSTAVAARESLTLSWPTIDAEGHEVLRSYFVDEVARCFARPPETTRRGLSEMIAEFDDVASPEELLERSVFELFGRDPLLTHRDRERAEAGLRALAVRDAELLTGLARAIAVEDRRDSRLPPDEYDARLRDPAAIAHLAAEFGPDYLFSPSALARFGSCPFAFFAETVLGLVELKEPSEDVDALLLGSAVHRILSAFFRDRRQQREDMRLEEDDLPAARALLGEIIDRVFADEVKRGAVADRSVWAIARAETRRDLELLLAFEAETVQAEGGRPFRFEQRYGATEQSRLEIGAGDEAVRLTGRIDRVDLLPPVEGRTCFAVYDYKLGDSGGGPKDILAGREFQLPMYALAARQVGLQDESAVVGGWGYYRTKRPPKLYGGPGTHDPEALIAAACAAALQHAARIRAGDFAPAPTDCRYCDFRAVCRWDEYRFARKRAGEGGERGG